ncbi:MAG: hypothetical protein DRP42_05695 [Tenericutes bacterium]|nr:MAG: hypothetical protein DRP42_05695 [Mycoplasmatota bacterium]
MMMDREEYNVSDNNLCDYGENLGDTDDDPNIWTTPDDGFYHLHISFGQRDRHVIDGVVFDKDCIGDIRAHSYNESRCIAASFFGRKFCTTYEPENTDISYYPRGVIPVNYVLGSK